MLKKISIICLSLLLVLTATLTASADSNYKEYTYNMQGESVPTPETYEVDCLITGNETGTAFVTPKDIVHDKNGDLFILDSGNDRICRYDQEFNFKSVIKAPKIDNKQISFTTCSGLFYSVNDEIYVTDTDEGCIYVITPDGEGLRIIGFKPQPVVDEDFIYKPVHLTVDSAGIMQVQAEGCYSGLITMDQSGAMLGYCGSNKIQASAEILVAMFWRKIFSQSQQDNIKQIIPVEFASVTMDKEGFVYTVTKNADSSMFEIMKLNPAGDNVLNYKTDPTIVLGNGNYGDMRTIVDNSIEVDTQFGDISVDEDGFIFGLDISRGRVFQYDQNSNLISIFGGMGDQVGTFKVPNAISTYGGKVFVLDQEKARVTVFKPTEYTESIRAALLLDEDGKYDDALPYWEKASAKNINYQLAISGLGKGAMRKKDYAKALKYFELAEDRTNYDLAFTSMRAEYIRSHFGFMVGGVVVILLAYLAYTIIRKRKVTGEKPKTKRFSPFGAIVHPFKSFVEMKEKSIKAYWQIPVLIVGFLLVRILRLVLSGFLFNYTKLSNVNLPLEFAAVIGIYLVFIVSNWLFCDLTQSEAHLRDIAMVTAIALLPYMLTSVVNIALSNILTTREAVFMSVISVIGLLWSGLVAVIGLMTMHNFTFGKTLVTLLITVVFMALIAFLGVIFFSLTQQLMIFVKDIYNEIIYKL